MSEEVNFKASAACSLYSQLFHKIDEQDSGEITEYQVFSTYIRDLQLLFLMLHLAPSPTIIVIIAL
jgi:hypothetical protein